MRTVTSSKRLLLGGACAVLALAASAAAAQTAAPAGATQVEEVIVSGSRIVRDGFDAPTPVTVVGADQLRQAAQPSVFTAINQMPQMVGGTNPTAAGAASTGLTGLQAFNMRGLGTNRTLVLMDGQRVVPAANTGVNDASLFPQALIQRVDVVTGGASASWGSDAVAGVVNFVLDKTFQGFKGNFQVGETEYGDGEQGLLQLTGGAGFADGRGRFIASLEYGTNDGVDGANTRPWYTATKMLQRSIAGTPAGQPQYLVADHVTNVQFAPGGLITGRGTSLSAAIVGLQFGAGGAATPFQFGSPTIGFGTVGGDQGSDLGWGTDLAFRVNRGTFYSRLSWELTPSINVFATAQYGETMTSQNSSGAQWKAASLTIQCDNPFLPVGVATACGGAGHSFQFGTTNISMDNAIIRNLRTTERYVVGGDGEFGLFGHDWTWDAYYQHGKSVIDNAIRNLSLTNYYNAAIDAVRDPVTGAIVCRSAVARSLGCVPMNVIGTGLVSDAANDWVNPDEGAHRITNARQDSAAFTVNGQPFSIWAGPVAVAAGAEYRKEAFDQVGDPYSQGDGGNPLLDPRGSNWWIGNFRASKGEYSVSEVFAEGVFPLFRDSALGGAEFTAAGRATWYSTAGYNPTWKLGLTWDTPVTGLRFRGLVSRDIRAPTLADLYAGATVLLSTLLNPFPPSNGASISVLQNQVGNPNLVPEIGTTRQAGLVYQPEWLPGFSASVDYYRIAVDDAIGPITLQQTMDLCFQGNALQCADVQPDPRNGTVPTQVFVRQVNLASVETEGFDLEASYRTPLDSLISGAPGNLTLRSLATHVTTFLQDSGLPNQPLIELAGQNGSGGNVPDWRWLGTAAYDNERFSVNMTGRWVSDGVINTAYIECESGCPLPTQNNPTINNNHVEGAFWLDIGGSYNLNRTDERTTQIYFKIDNVLNKAPPRATGPNANIQNGANNQLYDVLGRTYLVGIRFTL